VDSVDVRSCSFVSFCSENIGFLIPPLSAYIHPFPSHWLQNGYKKLAKRYWINVWGR
jgi:hypothetical protein